MLQATIINFKIKIIHLKNIYNKLKITFTSIATLYITGQGRTDENITYITITHYISLHLKIKILLHSKDLGSHR